MTSAEMERAIEFILGQQASVTASLGELGEKITILTDDVTALKEVTRTQSQSLDQLATIVQGLADGQGKLIDGQGRLTEGQARLAEAQAHSDERLARLAEVQAHSDERLARLAEAQARGDERLARLAESFTAFQAQVGQAFAEMAQAMTRTNQRIDAVEGKGQP